MKDTRFDTGKTRIYGATELTYRFVHAPPSWNTWRLVDTIVVIHERLDEPGFFVGASQVEKEHEVEPRLFPTLEAAIIYLKLVAS